MTSDVTVSPDQQLDRFLMRVAVGYPDLADERAILLDRASAGVPLTPRTVASLDQVAWMTTYTSRVYVAPEVASFVATISHATRGRTELRLGASPRASLALLRAAQVWAACEGRGYVIPDDVKAVAHPVLSHRMLLEPDAELRGVRTDDVITDVLRSVPAPSPATR